MAETPPQDPPISSSSSASPPTPDDVDTCTNPKKRKNSTITLENFDLSNQPPPNSFTFDTIFTRTPDNTPKFGSFNFAPEVDCVGISEPEFITNSNSATDFPVQEEITTAATTATTTTETETYCESEVPAKKRKKEVEEGEERREEVVLDSGEGIEISK